VIQLIQNDTHAHVDHAGLFIYRCHILRCAILQPSFPLAEGRVAQRSVGGVSPNQKTIIKQIRESVIL